MLNIEKTFGTAKPIIAMVHLQGSDQHPQKIVRAALADVEKLQRGGVDGLLFENWGLYVRRGHAVQGIFSTVMFAARRETNLPFGVNVLPFGFQTAFTVASYAGARFVQVDTFVDVLSTGKSSDYSMSPVPEYILQARVESGCSDVALITNIQSKHYTTLPLHKPLSESASQAARKGSDALVVTGTITGEEPLVSDIREAKAFGGGLPVLVGSGLDYENARTLLNEADGAIVGTSIKRHGITENPVDEQRVAALMRVVRELRQEQAGVPQ